MAPTFKKVNVPLVSFALVLTLACAGGGATSTTDLGQDLGPLDVYNILTGPTQTFDTTGPIGQCQQDSDCDDFDECTEDVCDLDTNQCTFSPVQGCATSCFVDSDCDDEDDCTVDTCDSNQNCSHTLNPACSNLACSDDTGCIGAPCVDGFCCDTLCDGVCEACNLSGLEGTCSAITNLPDPESCDAPQTCDSAGNCAMDSCGGAPCPTIPGYVASCNDTNTCEYRRALITEDWHEDDVWVYRSPGTFDMGAPESEGGPADERPVHSVTISYGYLVGKFEVTARVYEACEDAQDCTTPVTDRFDANGWGVNRVSNGRGLHPQNGLTWDQAKAVCGFLTSGSRLPTEAEWEYAANGPGVHRTYPWGNSPEPQCDPLYAVLNPGALLDPSGYGCGTGGTMEVGSTPAGISPIGARDMIGNVWEWTSDCPHFSYDGAPTDGSAWITDCSDDARRVQRGAGFVDEIGRQRIAVHQSGTFNSTRAQVGVRCVLPLD